MMKRLMGVFVQFVPTFSPDESFKKFYRFHADKFKNQ